MLVCLKRMGKAADILYCIMGNRQNLYKEEITAGRALKYVIIAFFSPQNIYLNAFLHDYTVGLAYVFFILLRKHE